VNGAVEARATAAGLAHDAWLDGLKGKHRQLFAAPQPEGGIRLNCYDTYHQAYSVADQELKAVLTFYGGTTFHGLNDAMWAKQRPGEFMKSDAIEKA
jgi:hypothetical protein